MRCFGAAMRAVLASLAFGLGGCVLPDPDHVPPNPEADQAKSVEVYREAVQRGDAQAMVNLGQMYERGWGGRQPSFEEAVRLYRMAADKGNAVACVNLAIAYASGKVPGYGDADAALVLKRAVRQDDRRAKLLLASLFVAGRGNVPVDDADALASLTFVAEKEYRVGWANARLAEMYERGEGGLPVNLGEAVRYYERALKFGRLDVKGRLASLRERAVQ